MTTRALHVLLAEDDGEVRFAVARLLESYGCEVELASDGAQALEALGGVLDGGPAPDVVVTDIRMPGVSGLTLLEGMRALGSTTPVIVMSAFGDDTARARVRGLAWTSFFDKPLDLDRFEATVKMLSWPLGDDPERRPGRMDRDSVRHFGP